MKPATMFLTACAGFCLALTVRAATYKDVATAGELLAEGKYQAAEMRLDRIVAEGVSEMLVGDALTDQAQELRALARAAQGKLAEAAKDAATLAKPRSSLTVPETAARIEALIKLRSGDRNAALAAYDHVVELASQGMASGARRANALALRAWAKLYFGETDAARSDFEAAAASDGTIMFVDLLKLQKPFWRAVVDEALPLFAAGKTQEGLERVEALVARFELLPKLRKGIANNRTVEGDSAANILWYEIHGPLAALRVKHAEIVRAKSTATYRALLAEAQQALLDNDLQRAFDGYVTAFRNAGDADERDEALAGIATVTKLLPRKPPFPEELRRLLVKANVLAEEKDYLGAIGLYAQAYRIAPWHAPLYHDRALLIGRIARVPADFDLAMREMRRFLLFSSDAIEARAAQDKIYEWEAKRERARHALPEITPTARGVSATAAGSEDCFIATAAFGSPWETHVVSLRAFRDRYLLSNAPGRWLVARYYELSPPIADFIREREVLRAAVRGALTPVVIVIERPVAGLVIFVALVGGGMLWRRRGV